MNRRARKPSTCHAPGCSVEISRAKLMCREHWFALPRPLREAITAAWREGRISDWSANCLEARAYLANNPDPQARNAALRDRILGER